ncbi:hypothetical protein ABR738_15670 [Streptomyces sp. Edi4]|uniref:hypothetical protein n=1 Tax=Streptomyces sp. Edi4 TaxID=3162527 RepID=UPI003305ACB6
MKQQSTEKNGLFYAFGAQAEKSSLHWQLDRRHGWRSPINRRQRRNDPSVLLRTHRHGMTWWLMSGWFAGGPLKK